MTDKYEQLYNWAAENKLSVVRVYTSCGSDWAAANISFRIDGKYLTIIYTERFIMPPRCWRYIDKVYISSCLQTYKYLPKALPRYAIKYSNTFYEKYYYWQAAVGLKFCFVDYNTKDKNLQTIVMINTI